MWKPNARASEYGLLKRAALVVRPIALGELRRMQNLMHVQERQLWVDSV